MCLHFVHILQEVLGVPEAPVDFDEVHIELGMLIGKLLGCLDFMQCFLELSETIEKLRQVEPDPELVVGYEFIDVLLDLSVVAPSICVPDEDAHAGKASVPRPFEVVDEVAGEGGLLGRFDQFRHKRTENLFPHFGRKVVVHEIVDGPVYLCIQEEGRILEYGKGLLIFPEHLDQPFIIEVEGTVEYHLPHRAYMAVGQLRIRQQLVDGPDDGWAAVADVIVFKQHIKLCSRCAEK